MSELANALKRNNLEEASRRISEGEKLPGTLADFDRRQIYDVLVQGKAYGLINALVEDGTIETDIYEYEKFEGTIFESLFKRITVTEEYLAFLRSFTARLDNINDALQDKTLLGLAFLNSAPMDVIRILVEAGCDVRYKNNADAGFLYKIVQEFAIKEDIGLQYLTFLVEEGLDPNEGNIVGETPLHLAISKNIKLYINFLLQHGADINQPDKNGETPLFAAVVHQVCTAETYKSLTAYGAPDFDRANKEGETLLLGAVRMRRRGAPQEVELLKALINDGADVYQTSPYYAKDKSALDWLCEQPVEALQAVLETGVVDINRKDDEGNTLLHNVCAYNVNYDQEAAKHLYRKAKLLIENGADANAVNDQDQTPMMLAVQDNLKAKTVELLLKHKV